MKLRTITLLFFACLIIVPMALLAQEATPEVTSEPDATLSLLDALEIVQAQYADALILEIQMEDEQACWKFEFADGTELCVDALTGEIIVDDSPEATPEPEATPDPNAPVPEFTMAEAIAKALDIYPDSVISKIELETWPDGSLVWEIKLDGNKLAVEIDATTGKVYDFGYDHNDDEGDTDHQDSYNDDNQSEDSYSDDSSSHDSYDDSSSHDSYDDSSSHDSHDDSDDSHDDSSSHDSHEDDHSDDGD